MHADSLATLATSSVQSLPQVILVEDLCKPTEMRKQRALIHQIRIRPSWMDPIMLFLKDDIFSEEKGEANKVRRRAPRFWLFENQKLYKRFFSRPYLLCIHPEIVDPLLEELHEEICGIHTDSRPYLLCIHPEIVDPLLEELHEEICGIHTDGKSLSHKTLIQGYWWPNMQKKAQEYVKKCDQC